MESGLRLPARPKISVITVCFNSAETLSNTLQSVADQAWPNREHILVDGASTDGTMGIVGRYLWHLSTVVSEPDQGIYDAMNKGLSLATGDIVCFLNSDDHYSGSNVLSQVAEVMGASNLDAFFGDAAFFGAGNPERIVRRYVSGHFRPSRLAYGWMPAHPALFMRRSVYDRVGQFRTDYRIAGDFEFLVRAFRDDELIYRYTPEILVLMKSGGISTSGWRSKVLLNKEVMRACRENGIHTSWLKILTKYPTKLFDMWFR